MTHHVNGTVLIWMGLVGLLFLGSLNYYQWWKGKTKNWDIPGFIRVLMGYLVAIISIIAGIILNK